MKLNKILTKREYQIIVTFLNYKRARLKIIESYTNKLTLKQIDEIINSLPELNKHQVKQLYFWIEQKDVIFDRIRKKLESI